MKPGDLVKYVGSCAMYRDRIGTVAQLYALHDIIDSATVHFTGLEYKGRAKEGLGQTEGVLHPMSLIELEKI